MFKRLAILHLLLSLNLAYGHGHESHEHADGNVAEQYAQRHMATEHHIDSFDAKSFFHLHDLNRDGFLDREEIEAIYGVHHPYSQKKSKDEEAHQQKADHIVNAVLKIMDKNNDGKLSPEEFEKSGLNALPSFENLGAEGHHYDIESEFFLHHEEQYHSTPETQTDESYNHPEDLEHFAHHEKIELEEIKKEAVYQGISLEEALAEHEQHEAPPPVHQEVHEPAAEEHVPAPEYEAVPHPHDDQREHDIPLQEPPAPSPPTGPKITRQVPPEKLDPSERYKNAREQSMNSGEWGSGDAGYKFPKTPGERLRKNVPYKYKFRRNWGDF